MDKIDTTGQDRIMEYARKPNTCEGKSEKGLVVHAREALEAADGTRPTTHHNSE